ncbi:hypothetical protein BLNAU_12018 [Blattamonas nauphoetae]|uniref:Uncharacterized protein n=1 Tax=Blattamonas nauphoetae TaxID=2049346 RepID=A0ABQ9XMN8_9EUKA|nr:hypothetical protein BLNAU_12018 [Blattamonas nauphoetae]
MTSLLTYNNLSTEFTYEELRMQLNTIVAAQTSVALSTSKQGTSTYIFLRLFELPPNTYEMDEATGLVVDHSRTASPTTVRTVTQYLTSFLLANVPEITLSPQQDGSVVDEPLEPKIEKMLQFIARTAFFQTAELVYAAYLIQRLVEVDVASGRPQAEWIVSNNNIGTVLVVSLLLSNKINRDVPIRSSWWAKAFGIPLSVLNSSEEYFLVQLNYEVSPTDIRVASLLEKVLDVCST